MRRGLLWMALLAAPGVQAAPACEEPVAVAQAFFKASVDDFLASPPALLTPAFARAMAGERECQRVEQGICRFDRDPWLDGQDGEIDAPPRFVARPSKAGAPVVVEARYPVWG
ncbi:hypothetical protein, partial [Stenotrophomonas sp.]|uniref:hypothetical protein n=1 Tax=Stenotrophomonas sp. TaxID=69392 RepID=UPI002FC9C81B